MRKAAKVYDASESIEGAKPKVVYESHKKCTPGEFGAHVKEAMRLRLGRPMDYGVNSAVGGGLGAILGALTARRGKLLRGAMQGGLIGAGAGAGATLGGALTHGAIYDHILRHEPLVLGGAGLGGLLGAGAVDAALNPEDEKKEKTAFEKSAIPAFGGRNYSLAPRGFGLGLNAGYDYLGGVVPNPYLGVDIGTPHTGMMLSGPIPGIGFRSGMFTRPPGATSGHNRNGVMGYRSLWKYLADAYSGKTPEEAEDEVRNDRLQSMRNVTKDEFYEAIPDYHTGPKGKPLSKELHKALAEYYHAHSRPEKQSGSVSETLSTVKESAGSGGGLLGRFLAGVATAGGAGAALNSAAKKRPAPVTPAPTIAENALSRRRDIEGMLKTNSAHEFGEKLADAYNPELHKLLQQWANAGGSQSAYPMSADYQKKPAALSKNLAAALRKHYGLPEQSIPDETDAAQALMFLEDEHPSNANFPAKFVDKDGFINIPMKGAQNMAGGEKLAATPGGMFGKALGALSNMGKPVANVGKQLPAPRLPIKPGTTPAALERTTGTILNSAGVPVPKKAPPPVPTVPKVKISPAEAAAATPMPKPPGLITPNPATRKPLGPEGWGRVPAAPKDWGRVPTGPTSAAQAQSFFDNATGAGRQRMLGFDPQARPAPAAAPQSWTQLSPAQQQAVQGFYSGGPRGQGMLKTQSAREFGQKVAFNIDLSMLKNPTIGGAALGAGLGGLSGLIAPGTDENGKTRSRFGAMLRGALGGGAVGGLGGAAMGQFAPDLTQKLTKGVNAGRMMTDPANYREMVADLQGKTFPPQMRIPTDVRRMYNASQYGHAVDPMESYYATLAGSKPQQQ